MKMFYILQLQGFIGEDGEPVKKNPHMKNNKYTKQWEESPVREKIRSKRKKRKYKERLAIKKQFFIIFKLIN